MHVCVCIRRSTQHPIVKEESTQKRHSSEAVQVNHDQAKASDVTTPSLRVSRNASKSNTHKGIQVSSDPSTPMESPVLQKESKNLMAATPLSKESNHSDHSEKLKLALTGKITVVACNYIYYIVITSMNKAALGHCGFGFLLYSL